MTQEKSPKQQIIERLKEELQNQGQIIYNDDSVQGLDKMVQVNVLLTLKKFLNNYDEYEDVLSKYEANKYYIR